MKKIEIPFGAFDSELQGFEYTIPDGYTAKIVDGKIIVRKEESEDEKIRGELIRFIKGIVISNVTEEQRCMWIAWLEKKEKQGEYKSSWGEEDEKILNRLIKEKRHSYSSCEEDDDIKDQFEAELDFLESIKERMQPQTKQEWSEEDEVMLGNALWACKEKYCSTETYNWLKSIKDRMTLTNKNDFDRGYEVGMSAAKINQWKPTKEQMKAIREAVLEMGKNTSPCEVEVFHNIESLYNDLKKL